MTINVGLIGYGFSGSIFHAPIIEKVPQLQLKTVVSSDAEKVHRNLKHAQVVSSLDQLLEDGEIQLVVVTSPNTLHFEHARKAILAGKHVVVEKPFVVHATEADELIELAKKQGVLLSVYQNRRWDGDFLTVRKLIESGVPGNVVTYEAHFDRFRPEVRNRWREQAIVGSGILYDLGAHLIDQALVLFGLPEYVQADLQVQRAGAQTIDYFHIILHYPKLRVILHSGMLIREPGPHFQIHGDRGSFVKYGLDPQEDALKQGMRPGDAQWGKEREELFGTLTTDINGLAMKATVETLLGSYEVYYQAIAAAILEHKANPVRAEEGRNTIRVIECAMQSQREQRIVAFK